MGSGRLGPLSGWEFVGEEGGKLAGRLVSSDCPEAGEGSKLVFGRGGAVEMGGTIGTDWDKDKSTACSDRPTAKEEASWFLPDLLYLP